MKFEEKLRIS